MVENQNIHYEVPDSQHGNFNLKDENAHKSLEEVNRFISTWGHKPNREMCYVYFWSTTKDRRLKKLANSIKDKISAEYGQGEPSTQTIRWLNFGRFLDIAHNWNIEESEIDQAIEFINSMDEVKALKPNTAIAINTLITFYLHGVEENKHMQSAIGTTLSPFGNKASILLNFPHQNANENFLALWDRIKLDCPIPIKEKHLYSQRFDGERQILRHIKL